MKKSGKPFEVVSGRRDAPGRVLSKHGTTTEALRAWEKIAYTNGKRNDVAVFFRKVSP